MPSSLFFPQKVLHKTPSLLPACPAPASFPGKKTLEVVTPRLSEMTFPQFLCASPSTRSVNLPAFLHTVYRKHF